MDGPGDLDPRLDEVRDRLLRLPGVVEEFPFGPGHIVPKVMGRMFAILAWEENPLRLNLKCDPERAVALREQHAAITPGYHMNKRHWNTLILDGSLPDDLVYDLIDHSYDLVVRSLRKADREALRRLAERPGGGPS
jgi:predicted DNA-binding protein (MmcQ/YjbR family)